MKTYKITFDRIGRTRNHQPLTVTANGDPETTGGDIADAVYGYARNHLISRDFDVYADPENGKGSIDGGKFGTFTIEEVPAP